jgi:hypothetical protein
VEELLVEIAVKLALLLAEVAMVELMRRLARVLHGQPASLTA